MNPSCEELLSCIEIQTRSLQDYSKEITNNIGQVLNLVRLQLLSFDIDEKSNQKELNWYGQLVGQAVKDLRRLTRQLQPDRIAENGLLRSITDELDRLKECGHCDPVFRLTGRPRPVSRRISLVLFSVLQQLLAGFLAEQASRIIRLGIRYTGSGIRINLSGKSGSEKLFLSGNEWASIQRKINRAGGQIEYRAGRTLRFRITCNTYGSNSISR